MKSRPHIVIRAAGQWRHGGPGNHNLYRWAVVDFYGATLAQGTATGKQAAYEMANERRDRLPRPVIRPRK